MHKICCFSGHRLIADTKTLALLVLKAAEELITKENIHEFWVGNYGDFDRLCAGAVRKLKEIYPSIRLVLVVPYLTKDLNENSTYYMSLYDEIAVADISEKTPRSMRIIACNRFMIDHSVRLIACVRHAGGAQNTLSYAKTKQHIKKKAPMPPHM